MFRNRMQQIAYENPIVDPQQAADDKYYHTLQVGVNHSLYACVTVNR
jgi:hypothetical protein